MQEKIQDKLYKMWLFREKAQKDSTIYAIRNARLSGAIALAFELGFDVEFNPLAEGKNPFTVK
jgi:hypothetical protein